MYFDDSIFLFHDFEVQVQIHQISLNHSLSRTEVHFIFVFMSKLSYLPLLSMLKNSKNGVTLRRPSIVPSQGDLVFLLASFVDTTLLGTVFQCNAILYSDFSQ